MHETTPATNLLLKSNKAQERSLRSGVGRGGAQSPLCAQGVAPEGPRCWEDPLGSVVQCVVRKGLLVLGLCTDLGVILVCLPSLLWPRLAVAPPHTGARCRAGSSSLWGPCSGCVGGSPGPRLCFLPLLLTQLRVRDHLLRGKDCHRVSSAAYLMLLVSVLIRSCSWGSDFLTLMLREIKRLFSSILTFCLQCIPT